LDNQKKPREIFTNIFTNEQKRVRAAIRTEQVFSEAEEERCARSVKTNHLREMRLAMEAEFSTVS
jgi:hypothetical protein